MDPRLHPRTKEFLGKDFMSKSEEVISSRFPEVKISGYTSIDGTIEFYNRINSLLDKAMVVLDFGAGRGQWYVDDTCSFRKNIRNLNGKVKKVIGCDIDETVLENRSLDESYVINIAESLPFADGSIDLIVSDYTFEHVANPVQVAEELYRILKPGGWICARTPNKYGYTAVLTRLIHNADHKSLLKRVQPDRKEIDVFPTIFKLNSLSEIDRYFDDSRYENYTYRYEPEPAYFFNNSLIMSTMLMVDKLKPSMMKSTLLIFLRRR